MTTTRSAVAEVMSGWWSRVPRGVIFDFNGTLSDDERILQEIFTDIFAEQLGWSLTAEDYFGRLAGYSDREIVETVVAEQGDGDPALVEDLLRLRRERYQRLVADDSPIGAGAVSLVRRLAAESVPMAIVTGAQRADVECVLATCPVGSLIEHVVAEEDVANGKPHPEGFIRGAELLGLPPHAVLVFEDSMPGVTAARAAGMSCIAVQGSSASPRLADVAPARVPALHASLLDLVALRS